MKVSGEHGRRRSDTAGRWLLRRSDPLEEGGEALAAADAHRLQPVADLPAGHLPGQRGQDPPAGGTHRVTQGDARTVDVGPLEVRVGEAPLPGDGQHLAGESLVELDQV